MYTRSISLMTSFQRWLSNVSFDEQKPSVNGCDHVNAVCSGDRSRLFEVKWSLLLNYVNGRISAIAYEAGGTV